MGVYILCTKVEFQNPLFDILKSKPCPCQCFTTILLYVTFQPQTIFVSFATISSVFCRQFFCLMLLLQGMLRKGDFRVSAFGPNLKPRRRMSTTGILTQFHPIPAEGPWIVSLWYNLQREVWAGVWVWIILSVGFVSSHFEQLAPSTIIYFDSPHRWVSRFKIWAWNASRMMLGEKIGPKTASLTEGFLIKRSIHEHVFAGSFCTDHACA